MSAGRVRGRCAAFGVRELLLLTAGALVLACTPVPESGADLEPGLRDCVDAAIQKVHARKLSSASDTPWVILHGLIAFEQDLRVFDAAAEKEVDAVGYLLDGARHQGKRIFRVSGGAPSLPPRQAYFQVQDHVDQVLFALADAGVGLQRRLVAEPDRPFTVRDLLQAAKRGFAEDQELGWTLAAFATYLEPDETWQTADGRTVSLEKILALAVQRDPNRETEGGTHHLYGVATAVRSLPHDSAGNPPAEASEGREDDVRNLARSYLRRYVEAARQLQQPDGAFSAAIFRGSAPPDSPKRLVWSTGHMLEWLTVAMTAEELREPWVQRATGRLCREIRDQPLTALSDGSMYHAAHALRRYREALAGG